jgi:DNA transformation protein
MSEFVEYLHEVLAGFGPVTSRRMFGGHGIYHEGLMFALVADDELYLKTDDHSAAAFSERGLEPFTYVKNGKAMQMSYRRAPEEIFDDQDCAREWAILAYESALRERARRGG